MDRGRRSNGIKVLLPPRSSRRRVPRFLIYATQILLKIQLEIAERAVYDYSGNGCIGFG